MKVQIKKLYPDAQLPTYGSAEAACLDLYAYIPHAEYRDAVQVAYSLDRAVIGTGISVAVPEGYVMEILPRSGLAAKQGLTVLNTPGQVDPDYRGEVKVILQNNDKKYPAWIRHGERIAQCRITPVPRVEWVLTNELGETERGSGGLGSTGV